MRLTTITIFLFSSYLYSLAQQSENRIKDNSFLIEEAFNQESGVVQHINLVQFNDSFDHLYGSFTQEWPIGSELHQLSYTIPYGLKSSSLLGNILINYRYQLVNSEHVSISPRGSGIIPTAHEDRFFGGEAALPLSISLSSRWMTHLNISWKYQKYSGPDPMCIPLSFERDGSSTNCSPLDRTINFLSGAGLVYYLSQNFNLLFEMIYDRENTRYDNGFMNHDHSFIANPGFRYAFNFNSGLQIVTGSSIAFDNFKDPNILFYLSFEHRFKKIK